MVCPDSGAAGGGLHPDGVQDLLRHLEELLAPAPLARLRPAHGVAPGRQELQDVDVIGAEPLLPPAQTQRLSRCYCAGTTIHEEQTAA